MNRQPSLFDPPQKPDEPREINLEGLRKHCLNRLYRLERANFLPWTGFLLKKEIKDFKYYGSCLPAEEYAGYVDIFRRELVRTKAAYVERFGAIAPDDEAATI